MLKLVNWCGRNRKTVVQIDPTHTTNMTRFLISSRGFSFLNESMTAWPTNSEYLISTFVLISLSLENASGQHQPVLHNRSQTKHREERQRGDDEDDARQCEAKRPTM